MARLRKPMTLDIAHKTSPRKSIPLASVPAMAKVAPKVRDHP